MTPYLALVVARQTTTEPATEEDVITDVGEALSGNGLEEWLRAGAIIVIAVVVSRVVRVVLGRLLNAGRTDSLLGDLVGRLVGYVIVAFGLVYSLDELGVAVGPILGALGVIGLALAFALQSVLENFVAGVLLQVRRPFERGDEIESLDHVGRVITIDSRTMMIRTLDNEIVRLPNAEVIKAPIVNLTREGRRRTRVDVGVAYGTRINRASTVARNAVQGVDGVLDTPAVTVQAFAFGASSIDLAVRFWHEPSIAEEWRVRSHVITVIAEAFEENDITIPFPQRTIRVAELPDRAPDPPTDG